jgi:hypothetical protein
MINRALSELPQTAPSQIRSLAAMSTCIPFPHIGARNARFDRFAITNRASAKHYRASPTASPTHSPIASNASIG